MKLTSLINHAFNFVVQTSHKYNIDESHALKHSMEVFHYANKIYSHEIIKNPFLIDQQEIIYVSSIIHDMCDKKYMNETKGIEEMCSYMKYYTEPEELTAICDIVSTMSYSKVEKNGFPKLNKYQLAYHIVREADLLTAYDVDRCIIYQMMHENYNYKESLKKMAELFENRVLQYVNKGLFVTDFSKQESKMLHIKALKDIQYIKRLKNID
jgi:HD superfamily phosphodiesterase